MLDEFDKKILKCLQHDASLPLSELAEAVGLSKNPCWRRVKRLEEEGYIRARVALLDPAKLNLHLTVFVAIKTRDHSQAWFERFVALVRDQPEVIGFYRMAGDVDYLMRVMVPDMAAFDLFYKRLIAGIELESVTSTFAMEEIKQATQLPLDYL